MKLLFDNGETLKIKNLTVTQWREFMAEFMGTNPNASSVWDIMGCVRGPDNPSENSGMSGKEHQLAYHGRRARKYDTVEVIREEMFFGRCGGAARHHKDTKVKVNPPGQQDHFDGHVVKAAHALGLTVEYLTGTPSSFSGGE